MRKHFVNLEGVNLETHRTLSCVSPRCVAAEKAMDGAILLVCSWCRHAHGVSIEPKVPSSARIRDPARTKRKHRAENELAAGSRDRLAHCLHLIILCNVMNAYYTCRNNHSAPVPSFVLHSVRIMSANTSINFEKRNG